MAKELYDWVRIRMTGSMSAGLTTTMTKNFCRCFLLLFLYLEEPSFTLSQYVHLLAVLTGTLWFKNVFLVSGKLCSPNKVPIDKFRPNNIMKAYNYLLILSQIALDRVVYGDKKLLKGSELYNRETKCNIFTGEVLSCFTHSDFRNKYCIVGFCTTNGNKTPVYFDIF